MGSFRGGAWKQAGDRELRMMVAILYDHIAKDGTGPWLVGEFKKIAVGSGALSANERGFVTYYLSHYLGTPLEVRLDDNGQPCELEGPKLLLRRGAEKRTASGRWRSVPEDKG